MKTLDRNFDYDGEIIDVMNFFSCSKAIAEKIIESSKINGNIDSIKRKCKEGKGTKYGG